MYLSYNAPHGPLQAKEDDLKVFDHIQDPKRRTYAAMMLALDRGIGRVLDCLEQCGERGNTLICFFSDNGGATGNASWNGELSGTKGTLREGGVRVPMIWSWPETIPGNQMHQGVISSLDLLPTFMAAAGEKPLPLGPPRSHEDRAVHLAVGFLALPIPCATSWDAIDARWRRWRDSAVDATEAAFAPPSGRWRAKRPIAELFDELALRKEAPGNAQTFLRNRQHADPPP